MEFNLVNVESWLKGSAVEGSSHDYLDRIVKFDRQLRGDFIRFSEHANERFFARECRAGLNFAVKEKSQVMLAWNLDLPAKLANGSRGVVIGFVDTNEYRALIKAIVDRRTAKPDESSCHQAGQQTQRDVSRDATESGGEGALIPLLNSVDKETAFTVIWRLLREEFLLEELAEVEKAVASGLKTLPLVRFLEGQVRIITPKPFSKEFRGCGTATRRQIPLQLAWAISIHKVRLSGTIGKCASPLSSTLFRAKGGSSTTCAPTSRRALRPARHTSRALAGGERTRCRF